MHPQRKTSWCVVTMPRLGIVTNDALGPSFSSQGVTNVLTRESTCCLHTLMACSSGANLPLINGHHRCLCHSGIGKTQVT